MTNGGMLDGYWETSYALRSRRKALERLRGEGVTEKAIGGLIATFDALEASVDLLDAPEGKERVSGVRSMDFWVGRFKLVAS